MISFIIPSGASAFIHCAKLRRYFLDLFIVKTCLEVEWKVLTKYSLHEIKMRDYITNYIDRAEERKWI